MSPQEQERLFTSIREAHPQWTVHFCSGYVHGVRDEAERKAPRPEMVRDAHDLEHYALGYLVGFAVRRGEDAECEPWFNCIGLLVEEAKRVQAGKD